MSDLISRIAEAIEAEMHEAWTESDADYNRGMEMAVSIVKAMDIRTDGDLISRQDAVEAVKNALRKEDDWFQEAIASRIEMLPSAPDSRQRGEWVHNDKIGTFKIFTCDKCGCNMDTDAWNFCPNCGSLMDKGGEDE